MLIIPNPNPGLLVPKRFDFAYIPGSAAGSGTDLTTYTFGSVPLGSPDGTRTIVVAVTGRASKNRSISSVTVAGVAATEIAQSSNTAGGFDSITGIYRADVPIGASGDIIVTFSGGMVRAGIAAYRMVHAASGAYDSTIANSGTSGTIYVPAGGAALAVSFTNAVATATWTGLTKDGSDTVLESASSFSTASGKFESAQSDLSVSATWSSSSSPTSCIASFAPA